MRAQKGAERRREKSRRSQEVFHCRVGGRCGRLPGRGRFQNEPVLPREVAGTTGSCCFGPHHLPFWVSPAGCLSCMGRCSQREGKVAKYSPWRWQLECRSTHECQHQCYKPRPLRESQKTQSFNVEFPCDTPRNPLNGKARVYEGPSPGGI